MTPDEIAKLIPDNVVEALLHAWLTRDGSSRECLKQALAAGLAAWGGMDIDVDDPHLPPHFFLPIEEPKA